MQFLAIKSYGGSGLSTILVYTSSEIELNVSIATTSDIYDKIRISLRFIELITNRLRRIRGVEWTLKS